MAAWTSSVRRFQAIRACQISRSRRCASSPPLTPSHGPGLPCVVSISRHGMTRKSRMSSTPRGFAESRAEHNPPWRRRARRGADLRASRKPPRARGQSRLRRAADRGGQDVAETRVATRGGAGPVVGAQRPPGPGLGGRRRRGPRGGLELAGPRHPVGQGHGAAHSAGEGSDHVRQRELDRSGRPLPHRSREHELRQGARNRSERIAATEPGGAGPASGFPFGRTFAGRCEIILLHRREFLWEGPCVSHVTEADIQQLVAGRLGAEERRRAIRHLLSSCPECLAKLAVFAVALEEEREPADPADPADIVVLTAADEAVWDGVFDRALSAATRRAERAWEERAWRDRFLADVRSRGLGFDGIVDAIDEDMPGRARVEALLALSFEARYRSPREMLLLAVGAQVAAVNPGQDKQQGGSSAAERADLRAQ